jgi:hypothetical protein
MTFFHAQRGSNAYPPASLIKIPREKDKSYMGKWERGEEFNNSLSLLALERRERSYGLLSDKWLKI